MDESIKSLELTCRICRKRKKPVHLLVLFERSRKKVVQIEDLTGLCLENLDHLPHRICKKCQRDLEQAHAFRQRCLDTQEYYKEQQYKEDSTPHNSLTTNSKERRKLRGKLNSIDIKEESLHDEDLDDKFELHKEIFLKNEFNPNAISASDDNRPELNEPEQSYLITEMLPTVASIIKTPQSDDEDCIEESADEWSKRKKSRKKRIIKDKQPCNLICDQCGNHFTCRQHFLTHLRRHAGDKRVQCEICPDKFYTNSELKRHMRRHTGERPFACKHCERRFTDYSTRIKHERTHTNERPFSCPHCPKAFTTSYILKNHLLIHTGERSFRCSPCDKSFQRQSHLVMHYRSIMHKKNEERAQKIKYSSIAEVPVT